MSYERDFYQVERDAFGKVIHFAGFTFDHDERGWVNEELTFCYVDVSCYSKELVDMCQSLVTHYQRDVEDIEELVTHYFGDEPIAHLPMCDVTQDTPCGFYWCYFEEE